MITTILAGTRTFGAATLDLLHDRTSVLAVVAPPGDPCANRAVALGLPVLEQLPTGHYADLIVAAHSHTFISGAALASATLGGIGYHPSLLPRHRGRDAVRWTIHTRDPIAGGTVYWLTDNVDGGPIAAARHLHVDHTWDHHHLWRRLFPLGLHLYAQVLDDLDAGRIIAIPQDETCATWEPSWERPPLHRPDLPQLGHGPTGYTTTTRPPETMAA